MSDLDNRQIRALRQYGLYLDKAAADAARRYPKLREEFSLNSLGEAYGVVHAAAGAADAAQHAADQFRAYLEGLNIIPLEVQE